MNTMELAQKIADLVIDKSHLNNVWYLIFLLLIIGLISAIAAWGGSYLSTKAQNKALKHDFTSLLDQVKIQTKTVKQIEEDIQHNYWYKREILKIKIEKIEEACDSLNKEMSEIQNNLAIAMSDIKKDITPLSEKAKIIISLYFNNEMNTELEQYINVRNACITFQRKIYTGEAGTIDQKADELNKLMSEFGFAKAQVENAFQKIMQKILNG